ncbi:MAG: PQQ-dependent sugar dehydrogenase [Gammaproteobacteria bacterium]|nr:PQQ-dependent sugar dehydrogenase [Gammaproteobacteria bacterium]NIR85542.1 PQQ-dependent sugar dehydrogenase [Gammaproteobacteria bacterium]NIR89801.1 PQQ-dependent sugar dehydrogenase [Gammaproteobacteria bacterium]NIU06677.1 PQQ-dependent sugar dehydrogenase [Gammaproteobacteria bacterium]NIV75068.1 glucose dehydrogenase [Gammaproteobacteria bacterium]
MTVRKVSLRVVALLALVWSGAGAAQDATRSSAPRCTDPGFDAAIPDIVLQRVGRGFEDPVFVTGDRRGGLLVVEQSGLVRRLDPEQGVPGDVFLDIRDRVIAGGERGLLGLALHPRFLRDGRLYVNYTHRGDGLTTRVSEFVMTAAGSANLDSERVLLSFSQPYGNHNGGMVLFGPDGDLYVGTGDGGAGNDPRNNGQRLDTLLGKILRIRVSDPSADEPYEVPPGNPFIERSKARPEIYAYGLRNPWRFSIDWVTGRLYAGDVGQNAREEIDVVRKGGNYGWRIMEGTICTPGVEPDCERSGLEPPILDYDHTQGYSVTGGYVYRGTSIPALCGVYLYADFGSGRLWGLRYDGERVTRQRLLENTGLRIASFGEDDAGELYVVDYRGRIYRIAPKAQSSGS